MICDISITEINACDCKPGLFAHFDRYKESQRNWYKEDGQWVLTDELFIEDWSDEKKIQVIDGLKVCIENGGCALGVYHQDKLIGFASVHAERFGTTNQYAELNKMHISNGFRGQGIGKRLFREICEKARQAGVKKLYISASPAEDSMAFYRKLGCADACEINQELQDKEPFDYQLEYDLHSGEHGC